MVTIEVRGVHSVEASEPVHLIDVAIRGAFHEVDWGAITQELVGQPRENWQVPYDERELSALPDGRSRAAFFFHYLDLGRPLLVGPVVVPMPDVTPLPADLIGIDYEEPR